MNRERRSDLHVIGSQLSPACYIEHSFPAVLYLAALTRTISKPPWSLTRMWAAIIVTAARCWALPLAHRWAMGRSPTLDPGPASRAELHEEIESFITRFGH